MQCSKCKAPGLNRERFMFLRPGPDVYEACKACGHTRYVSDDPVQYESSYVFDVDPSGALVNGRVVKRPVKRWRGWWL
jgi:excinuclease UvrABC ATPase subunit